MNKALKKYKKTRYCDTKYWEVFLNKIPGYANLLFGAHFNSEGMLDLNGCSERVEEAIKMIKGG